MKLAVIGTGYVGLVTGSASEMGNFVDCVDVDQNKLARLKVDSYWRAGIG